MKIVYWKLPILDVRLTTRWRANSRFKFTIIENVVLICHFIWKLKIFANGKNDVVRLNGILISEEENETASENIWIGTCCQFHHWQLMYVRSYATVRNEFVQTQPKNSCNTQMKTLFYCIDFYFFNATFSNLTF